MIKSREQGARSRDEGMRRKMTMSRACVIGSGPNGLAAAIVLAQAGLRVDVFEAEAEPGGAARTLPLTLPGFLHDFGSAVHPFAAGSPFFTSLPLADHGLEWIHGDAPLAHPLDDGTAVVLERDLAATERALGADGKTWRRLDAARGRPLEGVCRGHARAGAAHSASSAAHGAIRTDGASVRARFREEPFCERAHARHLCGAGGSLVPELRPAAERDHRMDVRHHGSCGGLADSARRRAGYYAGADRLLKSLGGTVHTSRRIDAAAFRELEANSDLVFFDTAPRQLLAIAGDRLCTGYRRAFERFQPGARRIQDRLRAFAAGSVARGGMPARDHGPPGRIIRRDCRGGDTPWRKGACAERPFVLVAQPTLFDPTRAPEGKHVLWAYCHVPNGSTFDMTRAH